MDFSYTFDPRKFLAICFLLILLSFSAFCQSSSSSNSIVNIPWLSANWATIALVISEALAFLPTRFAGIAKSLFTFFNDALKKKEVSPSVSR